MIGKSRATLPKTHSNWLSHLRQDVHHYIGIDGGSGANLLADLAGRDPYLQQATSPRQADLLIIVEPVSQKLVPAIVAMAQATASPSHVLIVGKPQAGLDTFSGVNLANLENLFPGAHRVLDTSSEQVLHAALDTERWSDMNVTDTPAHDETTIQLPAKQEQEMATELAVVSVGPLQTFSAGPLRLFLICDGEQVFSVQMETEYAYRGIESAMLQGNWQQGLTLARHFDPLAPNASQLVYVRALEDLQGWQASPQLQAIRELAVTLERVQNILWWLVRFARLLADSILTGRSYQVARQLAEIQLQLWQRSPESWLLPQYETEGILGDKNVIAQLQHVLQSTDALRQYSERNRALALRTRGIGILTEEQLKNSGLAGSPVLAASQQGSGDVQSRLVTRVQAAHTNLRSATDILPSLLTHHFTSTHEASWNVPPGEARATVMGPRGDIALHLVHQETREQDGPTQVEWQGPSAPLVTLLPELLTGQKLADAEVILASLDIAMAEVDG